jgi:hypothetical protein
MYGANRARDCRDARHAVAKAATALCEQKALLFSMRFVAGSILIMSFLLGEVCL